MRNKDRVKRILLAIPVRLRERLKAEQLLAVAPVVADMKAKAPVYQGPPRLGEMPGELRDSIRAITGDREPALYNRVSRGAVVKDPELTVIVVAGNAVEGTNRSDAHLQEFGTGHHDAQPFFFGTARAHKARVQRRMRRVVNAAIKDAVRGVVGAGPAIG